MLNILGVEYKPSRKLCHAALDFDEVACFSSSNFRHFRDDPSMFKNLLNAQGHDRWQIVNCYFTDKEDCAFITFGTREHTQAFLSTSIQLGPPYNMKLVKAFVRNCACDSKVNCSKLYIPSKVIPGHTVSKTLSKLQQNSSTSSSVKDLRSSASASIAALEHQTSVMNNRIDEISSLLHSIAAQSAKMSMLFVNSIVAQNKAQAIDSSHRSKLYPLQLELDNTKDAIAAMERKEDRDSNPSRFDSQIDELHKDLASIRACIQVVNANAEEERIQLQQSNNNLLLIASSTGAAEAFPTTLSSPTSNSSHSCLNVLFSDILSQPEALVCAGNLTVIQPCHPHLSWKILI